MLSKKEYIFTNIKIEDKNTYFLFGDNMHESIQIMLWFEKFNNLNLIESGYCSVSNYIRKYLINGETYTFVMTSYFHNGVIPDEVRELIKEIDKPDVILYSCENKKVVCGIESTETTMAGNATWQRTGRVINFLEKKIPFIFFSYYSKLDQSDTNTDKIPRVPGALFGILFVSLTLKYSTPAIIGFYEHDDPVQNINRFKKSKDFREDIFKYIYSIITNDGQEDTYLGRYFNDLRDYYFSKEKVVKTLNEFGHVNLKYIENSNFSKNIVKDIKIGENIPLFSKDLIFKWKPKKISPMIYDVMYPGIKFYQLSKNCKAGITFETDKFIERSNLKVKQRGYIQDSIKREKPTVILPIKLTKKIEDDLIYTSDPYNGEISAFSELYSQSYESINLVLLLIDHTNNNEYNVERAKSQKVYKSITKYADLLIDLDFNMFSKYSEGSLIDDRNKYETIRVTEDNVTCFFETILIMENIQISFINPPSGSWSDLRLYPTNIFYYYKRNDERADIAYYDNENNTYYIGESKDKASSLKSSIHVEERKVDTIVNIIKDNIGFECKYKKFALFFGSIDEAKEVLNISSFDYVAVVKEDEQIIKLTIMERKA